MALLFPLAEILAGVILIRLRWELPDPTRAKPLPGYLDEQFERMERGGTSETG